MWPLEPQSSVSRRVTYHGVHNGNDGTSFKDDYLLLGRRAQVSQRANAVIRNGFIILVLAHTVHDALESHAFMNCHLRQ